MIIWHFELEMLNYLLFVLLLLKLDSSHEIKKALKIKRELNEPEGISSALKSIGHTYYSKGQYKQAMVYYKKSLKER